MPGLGCISKLYRQQSTLLHIILSKGLMHDLKKGEWNHQLRPNYFVNALGLCFHSLTEIVWIWMNRASFAVRWNLGSNAQHVAFKA